ncbi:MAG: hypothetical protein AAF628_19555 [Planctomycetota bacterium]
MTEGRDDARAALARKALRDPAVRRLWRARQPHPPRRRVHPVLWVAAAASVLGLGWLAWPDDRDAPDWEALWARIDRRASTPAATDTTLARWAPAADHRRWLTVPAEDAAIWTELREALPDVPRAVSGSHVALLEPRGGVEQTPAALTVRVTAETPIDLRMSLRADDGTASAWDVTLEPGVRHVALPQGLSFGAGVRVAWMLDAGRARAPGPPALFWVVAPDAAPRATPRAVVEGPAARVAEAARLLSRGLHRQVLDQLDACPTPLPPATGRRARLLRAAAHAARGEHGPFAALDPTP